MVVEFPKWAQEIARVFAAHGAQVFGVGGWVRNQILCIPPTDLDICGPALPEQVLSWFSGLGGGVRAQPRALKFGTVVIGKLVCGKWLEAEYTTFRQDSYRGGHRPDSVTFTRDISKDARRRDLRANAIYADLATGEVVDPLEGVEDLRRGVLRAATCDPSAMLSEDGLRILRIVRFSAQLRIPLEEGMVKIAAGHIHLLEEIAPERIWTELKLILLSDTKYPGRTGDSVGAGLALLRELGLMVSLFGVENREGMRAAVQLPPNLPLRLAALCYGAGIAPLERLRCDKRTLSAVEALHRVHAGYLARPYGEDVRLRVWEMGAETALLHAQWLKGLGHGQMALLLDNTVARMRAEGVPWGPGQLALDGGALCRMLGGPGPRVGAAQQALLRHTAVRPGDNTEEALTEILRGMIFAGRI